jgi:sec-independent protein translocase protein TatA
MGNLGFGELLIIFLVVVFLFGGKRIPGLAKSLGESVKLFKKTLHGEDNDQKK